MDCEKEMYDRFCKDRFDKLEAKLDSYSDTMCALLKGSNGNPGVLADVRDLKRTYRAMIGAIVFLIGVLATQAIAWGWAKIFTS